MEADLIDIGFGVLSAFKTRYDEEQNRSLRERLHDEIRALGYKPSDSEDQWDGIQGSPLVIPKVSIEDLVSLARRFEQESAIYCPSGGSPRVLTIGGLSERPKSAS